ncbi:decarboxylating NADP(+)-dependent phosphogluconate dehydrogenase [uncultured Umboniibacter sp.]|uniref:decarboxylating NADP(+)-dependent phosphogluconate dehydrogenase n=1 Tax=uncultured Umboniibacter sp. TaxID=1798917 RepID=UPI00262D404C|nr:decarboxylating NADP(+)-dependent phosphogluconate dehydrogenase [uncultured Umboniibacter sp.]
MSQCDVALIGLAVMGQNLVLNMADNGYSVGVYNRTSAVTEEFLSGPAKGTSVSGFESLADLVNGLSKPRKIVLLVKAGGAVDAVIEELLPLVDEGDLIIDLGNSHFPDTQRRWEAMQKSGVHFIGSGVSGGEEGARTGPSIMPGGDAAAWPMIKDIFQSISAKVDGAPCCDWVGSGAAGHYVKMVHNGIEYGDMQLICEAYQLLDEGLGLTADELHQVFSDWNSTELDSYLIEITGHILGYRDEDGEPLVTKIMDRAGQKGTGKWTGISALDLGMPVSLIGESVFARCLSALKQERTAAAMVLSGPNPQISVEDRAAFINDVKEALFASKIISYTQGYMLLREASSEYGWDLNFGAIAMMWRGGCIIRSQFLTDIKKAFDNNPALTNLLLDDYFKNAIDRCQGAWRRVISKAVEAGIPTPCFSTALAFYDGYRRERLPANLLQAQRDYFGAHTYERVDRPAGEFFHTNWTGTGGDISSQTYNV